MGFSIKALVNYYFAGILYKVNKYYPIFNNVSSINIVRIFILLSTDFSFVDTNNIEYCTVVISYDVISSFTITLSNIIPASII